MNELAKKLAMEDALRKLAQHRLGSWERDTHHRWRWQDKKAFIATDHDFVYSESMKLVKDVQSKRSINTLNRRWRAFTGDGKLEVKWDTLTTFGTYAGVSCGAKWRLRLRLSLCRPERSDPHT